MLKPTEINDSKYFRRYRRQIGRKIESLWNAMELAGEQKLPLYQTIADAVYSSKIEGNTVDLNSFISAFRLNKGRTKEVKEIEDLMEAYRFAQHHVLNERNVVKAHAILSKTLLIKSKQGKYRTDRVGVFSSHGLVYLAVEPEYVAKEMELLFASLSALLKSRLTPEEALYYASLYHLKFAHIHPFADGNGRVARLVEKWFLAQVLGKKAWKISSEEYYWFHRPEYYQNINLGVNYYELEYDRCLPFLKMLPKALMVKRENK